jgi:hypothetical protein
MSHSSLPLKVICDTSSSMGIDRENARAELESTFCLSEGEANEFLDGNLVFCRSVPNNDIARKYKLAFGRIGLKCVIAENASLHQKTMTNLTLITDNILAAAAANSPEPPPIIEYIPPPALESPEPELPLIVPLDTNESFEENTPQLVAIRDEVVNNSSVFASLAKWLQEKLAGAKAVQAQGDAIEAQDNSTTKRKNEAVWATNLIYAACFFYLLTAIPEDIISRLSLLAVAPFPVMYVPLLVGTTFVTLSCVFLMRLKGYPMPCAAVGVGGPVGLGVTLLLPNKLLGEKFKALDKHNSVGYFLILAGLLWLASPTPVKIDPQPYINRAGELSQGRNAYPSTTRDDVNSIVLNESSELHGYLDDGFELIKKVGNDPEAVAQVSKTMFTQVSRLFQWLHHQRVLSNQEGKDIYSGKGDDSIQIVIREFMEQLEQGATRLGNEHFNQQFQSWLKPSNSPPTGDMQILYSDLVDTKLLFLRSGKKIDENFTLEDFELPEFSSADIQVKGNVLTLLLTTDDPEFSGSSLVVAFYPQAYNRRGIEGYDIVIEHIGGTLPNYTLPGWLNYLSGMSN